MTVGRRQGSGALRAATVLLLTCLWQGAMADAVPPLPTERPDPMAGTADRGIQVAATIPDSFRLDELPTAASTVPLPDAKPEPPLDGLFSVLSPADTQRYATIFAAQARADWPTADRLIADLDDPILMGHVLAQRYLHPTGWRSSWAELRDWLALYADQPDAQRIHNLAMERKPADAAAPRAPEDGNLDRFTGEVELTPASGSIDLFDWDALSSAQRTRLREIKRAVRRDIRSGDNDGAARRLAEADFRELADDLLEDRMAAEVAQGYLIAGQDDRALALAAPALERSGARAPVAAWIAGLAWFRQGELASARHAFEILAAGPTERDLVIAGAYWAARLNLMTGQPQKVRTYLQIAQTFPYSFYGLLARRTLGSRIAFDASLPTLDDAERLALGTLPEVRRAVALAEAGQQHRADAEFNRVSAGNQPALAMALLQLAEELGLPATQYRLGGELLRGYDERFDAALYPLPPWQPDGGFDVDPALLYAIMRRESGFLAFSRSEAGARGPMQIMPGTAAYISGDDGYLGAKRNLLNDPRIALSLAQDYIRHLLDTDDIDGNLFFVLAAYNAGPGNLKKWLETDGATHDPLLFIETIPSRETRFFVERVMAGYWMYRLRLGERTPSLDMVASGSWPLYRDEEQTSLARN